MKKWAIFCGIIDVIAICCFVLCYSSIPFCKDFQYLIISTAKDTKTHDYIAYTFWSEDYVSKVVSETKYVPVSGEVNLDDIVIDATPKDHYSNEYDEQILTRETSGDYSNYADYFKYIKVKAGKYDAHLVAIYDPSLVQVMRCKKFNTGVNTAENMSHSGEKILKMTERYNGLVGINAGGFADSGWGSDIPLGPVLSKGEIAWDAGAGDLVGFTKDNKLLLKNASSKEALAMGYRDAVKFGPNLIINGETPDLTNKKAGGYSRAARTAIAQRKDGVVLFLVTEGTHAAGPSLVEVTELLLKYGAYNATNLDGGTSVQLVLKNNSGKYKLINNPKNVYGNPVNGGRSVVTGFGLIPE